MYPTMVVKDSSLRCSYKSKKHLQVKKKNKQQRQLKAELFTTPDKSFFGSYHRPLGRNKLLIARS